MDSSLLKTLPLEIREMIYEKCFKDDFFATIKKPNSLALLQLCRELRTEAEQSLARRKKVIMNGNNMDTSVMTVLSPLQLIRLAPVVRAFPSHLNLNKLVFELRQDYRVIHPLKPSLTSDVVPPQFTANTRALVALVHPCEAVISVNMTFHKLAMVPYTKSLHEANPGKVRVVCPQDEPMTLPGPRECHGQVLRIRQDQGPERCRSSLCEKA